MAARDAARVPRVLEKPRPQGKLAAMRFKPQPARFLPPEETRATSSTPHPALG